MPIPLKKQIQALPSYLGSKRRQLQAINNTLALAFPRNAWHQAVFIDPFMGGGAVSYWAKSQGFKKIIANDTSLRAEILAEAFLINTRIRLSRADVLYLTQPLPERPGFVERTYCPHVFSIRHAQALDRGFYWARRHPDLTKRAMLLTIMWHFAEDFVAFATSLGTSNRPFAEALDGLRSWDEINPKRYTDDSLKRLCEPTWSRLEEKRLLVNGGVLGGSPVTFTREDALRFLPKAQGDILYLDPPYAGTVSYERSNQVLDALLAGEEPSSRSEISAFSRGIDPLEDLLAQASHIPVWLLSYGNQLLSLPELEDLVRSHAQGRIVKGFAKSYRHLSHVSKNRNNQELLILAYPKGGV